MTKKTPKQLERHLKGVANHRRIEILMLVGQRKGVILEEIAKGINSDFKNVSAHTQKLVQAGLLNKKYIGRAVAHELSPYGKTMLRFLKSF